MTFPIRTYLLLVTFILLCSGVYAQQNSINDNWYKGLLVLEEGETLYGHIQYDLEANLVQIDLNQAVKAYSARQIKFFRIHDSHRSKERTFYALPYHVSPNYKAPILFEVLIEGPITLLVRERIVLENIPQYSYWSGRNYSYTRRRIEFDFYFGFANGRIKRYLGSKKDFFNLVKDNSSEIKKFVKENRLQYNQAVDLIEIITYYNSLINNSK